ncbi:class I SAM-dependent methyltransferase [Pararhizobium haloflavum]|uniref:class I SAM-dependent methyltransferase n=1 Tax=Pararhizobium haloflavum TaxID=2037914 RepID=UPI000C17D8AB|nr:class I SAM-dependent methyltransferase [Pararhizobium haloflavum]
MHQTTPIDLQRQFWNRWNTTHREASIQDVSLRQGDVVRDWFNALGRNDQAILEVGCGSGWLCGQLLSFVQVTATDLSDEVLDRAHLRNPQVRFVAGDFMEIDFGTKIFDVIVTLEVLSHVRDQKAFVHKLASHLKPGGYLMMATQNRTVLQRFNAIAPPAPGQLRRWVDADELQTLLADDFEILELFSVFPKANKGVMRVVNSRKLNLPIRLLLGTRVERLKERLGLGWTLMALAKRAGPVDTHSD